MKYKFFIQFFRWKKLFEPNLSPFWKVGAWDCIKWWHVVVVANCSKFKTSGEFLHVPLLTGLLTGEYLLRLLRPLRLRHYQPYLLEIGKKRAKGKLLKVQSFRRVPTVSQGGPCWGCWGCWGHWGCRVTSHTYLKPPNCEDKSQSTKLQKSSYMYCFSSFSQRSLLRLWRRRHCQPYLLEYPLILKKRAKTIQKSQNYSKTIYDIDFVVPENLKKERKLTILYYSDYNGMSQCWIFAFI